MQNEKSVVDFFHVYLTDQFLLCVFKNPEPPMEARFFKKIDQEGGTALNCLLQINKQASQQKKEGWPWQEC